MDISKEQLVSDLRSAGIRSGDSLIVHSSLKSIGCVAGGALTVVHALIEAVGAEGGVLFPCLTFGGSVTEHLRKIEVVDLRTVTIHTGAIPRTAWQHPDSCRSLHPTHPVAGFGRRARESVAGVQSGQGPCGTDSPFYKAADRGAKILLIGVNCSSNTSLHCVEELHAPYVFPGDTFEVETIDFDGHSHQVVVKGYCVGISRRFAAVEPRMMAEGIMAVSTLARATLRIIDAKKMFERVSGWVRENPWLLAEKPVE